MSERKACRALGFCRASAQYRPRRAVPAELVAKLRELAAKRPRWGYRRLHILLRREGITVNHKRVYRLYRLEGLAVRRKRRKRLASAVRTVLPPRTTPNERWSMDYVSDTLVGGTRFRAFVVVDDFTRECLAIEVDTSIPGLRGWRPASSSASPRRGRCPRHWSATTAPSSPGGTSTPGPSGVGSTSTSSGPASRWRTPTPRDSTGSSGTSAWLDYNQTRPHSRLDNLTPLEFALRHNSVAADAA